MKTLILYSGHLGSTAKAAEILSEMIGEATVLDTALKPIIKFNDYDNIVFGTNVRILMLNKRFKKYAKMWVKSKCESKAFAYVLGITIDKSNQYIEKTVRILGSNAVAVFVGGELNSENAKGFAKKIIESVKVELASKNEPLPTLDEVALRRLADTILTI